MSDLRLLAFVLSGGFLFLGGIWLGGDYGLALLLLGLVVLLVPVVPVSYTHLTLPTIA